MTAKGVLVEIPKVMAEKARVLGRKFGYNSLTEFVKDSVRRRLEELEDKAKAEMEG
ncbi:hypothetical protein [Archaeoglobus veneficus]|uniref:CopG family transcriptional regulator n=1 Tax=Archaeoglobus veneficus (strain DSM 11195 / SNP6) TaxID=693661 RepID=F2KSA5_ARCVS|nr:hypothetical protein [Archaeoglobus veneficus]AEA48044.1 hypothetical protein Arcve_2054 [Archaeoglobus veneficus SNP6]